MEKMFKPLARKMKIEIEYIWRRNGDFAIPKHHIKQLEEQAMEHITFGMANGKTKGELSSTVLRGLIPVGYSGSWTATTKEG